MTERHELSPKQLEDIVARAKAAWEQDTRVDISVPTHDDWRAEKDRLAARRTHVHFWTNQPLSPELAYEPGAILIGPDPDAEGIAFHIGESVSFTIRESDLLRAIAEVLE